MCWLILIYIYINKMTWHTHTHIYIYYIHKGVTILESSLDLDTNFAPPRLSCLTPRAQTSKGIWHTSSRQKPTCSYAVCSMETCTALRENSGPAPHVRRSPRAHLHDPEKCPCLASAFKQLRDGDGMVVITWTKNTQQHATLVNVFFLKLRCWQLHKGHWSTCLRKEHLPESHIVDVRPLSVRLE